MNTSRGDAESERPSTASSTLSEESERIIGATTNSNIRSEDLYLLCSKDWAKEALINLSVLSDRQNFTYSLLLSEFSALGTLEDHIRSWRKLLIVDRSRDKIDAGLFETELISELCTLLEQMFCEKLQLDMQYDRLVDENMWLSEQRDVLKERLNKLNDNLRDVEAERNVQHFIYRMRHREQEAPQAKLQLMEHDVDESGCISELISTEMKGVYRLAVQYIAEGRLDVAVAMCTKLLRDPSRAHRLSPFDHGVINFLLGIILGQKGRLKESMTNMEDALETFEMEVGREHPSLSGVLARLAEGSLEMNNYKEAENYLQRALTIKRKSLGENHDEVIKMQADLCGALVQSEKNQEAVDLSQRTLDILMTKYPSNDPMVIKTKTLLSRAQLNLNQIDESYDRVKSVLKECFARSEGRTIVDLMEAPPMEKQLTQIDLCSLYDRLENKQEVDLLQLLRDIYKAQGNQDAFTQLGYLLDIRL
ncbi:hypothetical protein CRM22_009024 [Opisthorchis felineus]|uniref:Kinesin light chain n=1 Tax=Opisthorchis felineus TaxID=147828 RepID=A0A4S2L9B6_OPIFE|nr:hypothetical protein CRM22_009024 [Opisthorchis felineus]